MWPEVPKTPPKAWETFPMVIMKTFGTLRRVHNPCAEVPLIVKLGKRLDNEGHSAHKMIRDRNIIYVQEKRGGDNLSGVGRKGNMQTVGNRLMTLNRVIPVMGKLRGSGCSPTTNTTFMKRLGIACKKQK